MRDPRRLLGSLALASALTIVSSLSRAQTKPPTIAAPVLVPPKRIFAPKVVYPEGATGDAVVVMKLTVEVDGTVSKITIESGDEPFATAARENAAQWRFDPATRDGAPMRAAIRAKITFTAPSPGPSPTPSPSPTPTPTPTPSPSPTPGTGAVDIFVEGARPEIGTSSVGGGEIRILPGAFGDPFRAIEALPGVTPIISGLPYFYVRGAPPGNTGYFIDDIRVPMLFHLGAGPAIMAPALIDRVDFFPGGYPAQYGRYTGGIVAGVTNEPSPRTRGEWNVRLFDASAMVEGPIGKGDDHGDALVAGRYGYPGLLLSIFSPELSLQYWDYQVRAGKRVSDRDRLSVFFFGAYDRLYDKEADKTLFNTQFHRADFRWDRALPKGALRIALTLGFEQSALGDDNRDDEDVRVRTYGIRLRSELEQRLDDVVKLRAGADVGLERYELVAGPKADDARRDYPSRSDVVGGLRADVIVRASKRVELVPGVRLDGFHSKSATVFAVDPRFATRVGLADGVAWLSSFAITHQPPAFIVPIPGLQPDLSGGLQQAFQMSEGVEVALPYKVTATVTGFRHVLLNLTDFLTTCFGSNRNDRGNDTNNESRDRGFCDINDRTRGTTWGGELLVKRALTERLGGWIAYTLSRSDRTFRGVTRLSQFDRPHVLAVVLSYDLGAHWRVGGRFTYASGRPITVFPPSETGLGELTIRLPGFYRIDWRLEKRWNTSETSWIAVALEWFNTTLRKEPTELSCNYVTTSGGVVPDCRPREIGPVTIPSIGVEGGF